MSPPEEHSSSDEDDSSVSSFESASSFSLERELKIISKTVNRLDKFQPETTAEGKIILKKGRMKKTDFSDIASSLVEICKQNKRIIERLSILQAESSIVRQRLEAGPSTGSPSSDPSGESNPNQSITNPGAAPQITEKQATSIDSRLDQVEQNSLREYSKVDGEVVQEIIKKFDAQKKKTPFKTLFISTVNQLIPDAIAEENIDSVIIAGREKKHLKVKFSSHTEKLRIIRRVKSVKPMNFFISDYLTRNRSVLFYRLRNLSKQCDKIQSVYVYGGNICSRVQNNPKIFYINSAFNLDHFTTHICAIDGDIS